MYNGQQTLNQYLSTFRNMKHLLSKCDVFCILIEFKIYTECNKLTLILL